MLTPFQKVNQYYFENSKFLNIQLPLGIIHVPAFRGAPIGSSDIRGGQCSRGGGRGGVLHFFSTDENCTVFHETWQDPCLDQGLPQTPEGYQHGDQGGPQERGLGGALHEGLHLVPSLEVPLGLHVGSPWVFVVALGLNKHFGEFHQDLKLLGYSDNWM